MNTTGGQRRVVKRIMPGKSGKAGGPLASLRVEVLDAGGGQRVCLRCSPDAPGSLGKLVAVEPGFVCIDCGERWNGNGTGHWEEYNGTNWRTSHYGVSRQPTEQEVS